MALWFKMSGGGHDTLARAVSRSTGAPLESVLKLLEFVGASEQSFDDTSIKNYRDLVALSISQLRLARARHICHQRTDLIPPLFPSHVQIQTIAGCNASCPMCAMSAPHVRKRERGRMSTELFNKIVIECSQHDECEEIALYLQNEPLLDVTLVDKIKAVKTASKSRLRTRIVTNGSLLTEQKIRNLIGAGLDAISVSLNAHTPETYRKVMGGLDFETTLKNIDNILNAAPSSMLVTLTFMVTRDNEHEVSIAIDYWSRRGVLCGAYGINTMGGMVPSFDQIKPTNSSNDRRHAKECYLPIENAAILCNGEVLLCCTDWSRTSIFGNLETSSLYDVWHSPKMAKVRGDALINRFESPACQSCPGQTRVLENLVFYGGPGGSNAFV